MGAEIKQTLERSFDMVLSVGEIRNLTMGKLLELQGGKSVSVADSGDMVQIKTQVRILSVFFKALPSCFSLYSRNAFT